MELRSTLVILAIFSSSLGSAQDQSVIDSVKSILTKRYEALAAAMEERNLDKILSFKTDDFHAIGPDGKIMDNLTMKEYSRQFITNNIPPYNIKNTITNLRVSVNRNVAVADVLQESTRKRELLGKVREVSTSVRQTETWILHKGEWKLKLVDNVHDQKRYVDGKRVDPAKPYNPDDPPYNPDNKN